MPPVSASLYSHPHFQPPPGKGLHTHRLRIETGADMTSGGEWRPVCGSSIITVSVSDNVLREGMFFFADWTMTSSAEFKADSFVAAPVFRVAFFPAFFAGFFAGFFM